MKNSGLEEVKNAERAAGANPDPITGEPGAHPVGTAGGSAGGAAAGAALGAVLGGPVGALAGGVAGAVVGGAAGHAAAEGVNPTLERQYWEGVYKSRPYYKSGSAFASYEPAYEYGWENAEKSEFANKTFDESEPMLRQRWTDEGGSSPRGAWSDSKEPVKDAWNRVRQNAARR